MSRAFALLGAIFALLLAGATGVGLGLLLAAESWRDATAERPYQFDKSDEAGA